MKKELLITERHVYKATMVLYVLALLYTLVTKTFEITMVVPLVIFAVTYHIERWEKKRGKPLFEIRIGSRRKRT